MGSNTGEQSVVGQGIPARFDRRSGLVLNLSTTLYDLAENQRFVSIQAPPQKGRVIDLSPEPSNIRDTIWALSVELSELSQAMEIKPWRPDHGGPADLSKDKQKRVIEEFADVVAFFGLLVHFLEASGITPQELAEEYGKKSWENIQRFTRAKAAPILDGYQG